MANGRSIESAFNYALAAELTKTHTRWQRKGHSEIFAEETNVILGPKNRNLRPDLLILDNEVPPVAIECSYDAKDADQDAVARLNLQPKQSLTKIKTSIALHIPTDYRSRDVGESEKQLALGDEITYAVHQLINAPANGSSPSTYDLRRWPASGFIRGSVMDLGTLVLGAALPKEQLELVAKDVASIVTNAAESLHREMSEKARAELSHVVLQRSPLTALKTSMVLWLNALLTQQRLAVNDVPQVAALKLKPLPRSIMETESYVEIWHQIQSTNWRSIFDPALEVLELLDTYVPNVVPSAMFMLIRAVHKIEEARIGIHINVGAELFPELSEDRKEAAAFYTQAASSELLAWLAIQPSELSTAEWSQDDLFKKYTIADLACGTGSLLRAGYRRVAMIHEQLARPTSEDTSTFHQQAMQHGLIGTDISPIAAHLTASSLAALGEGIAYRQTRIGWLEVGGESAATGSLEYFERDAVLDLFDAVSSDGSTRGDIGKAYSVAVRDNSIDWILMNPPYSRTRGGQSSFAIAGMSAAERNKCQDRWGRLIKREPAIKTAGMAASFVALARKKVKLGGRIGFVLPLTAAFAESWRQTRAMLEREFEDMTAIVVGAGKALGRDAHSADTNMEEMFLVATRCHRPAKAAMSRWINCVTLNDPINRCGEAAEIARAVDHAVKQLSTSRSFLPLTIADEITGSASQFQAFGEGEPWHQLGVQNSELGICATKLAKGKLSFQGIDFSIPLDFKRLEAVAQVGPTHHLIGYLRNGDESGAFEFYEIQTAAERYGEDTALWHANSKTQNSLVVVPTHKGYPRNTSSPANLHRIRQTVSTSFYSRSMRWTSQSLLAATTERACLGGRAWTAIMHEDPRVLNAIALWSNSIFGLIVHWTQGQRTQTGRSTVQVKALRKVPCPDFNELSEASLNTVAREFDRLSSLKLRPACQAHVDPARIELDEAIMTMLDFPASARQLVEPLRKLWCYEPSVHGQNRQALDLLA